jgi:hypothetical protein
MTNPMKDSDEWLYTVLADYSNDLAALKKRDGKLPAEAAIARIQAHYQPQAVGGELEQIIRFVLGETMLDGMWFGDQESGKPLYWWRIPLRKALERQHPND